MGSFFSHPSGCMKWGETGLCSNHGICMLTVFNSTTIITEPNIPGSYCQCNGAWMGYGDFMDSHQSDCIHHPILVILFHLFPLITSIFSVSLTSYKLIQTFLSIKEKLTEVSSTAKTRDQSVSEYSKKNSSNNNHHHRHHNNNNNHNTISFVIVLREWWSLTLVKLGVLAIPTPFCWIIFSLLRLSSPTSYLVGRSVSGTILRTIASIGFWIFLTYLVFSWIHIAQNMLDRITKKKNHQLDLSNLKHLMILSILTNVIGNILLLVLISIYTIPIANIITFIFLLCIAIAAFLVKHAFFPTATILIASLYEGKDHLSEELQIERDKIINALNRMMKNFYSATIQNIFGGILFGFWPWMRNNYMYMGCLQGMAMSLILVNAVYVLAPPPRKKKLNEQPSQSQLQSQQQQQHHPPLSIPSTPSKVHHHHLHLKPKGLVCLDVEVLTTISASSSASSHDSSNRDSHTTTTSSSINGTIISTSSQNGDNYSNQNGDNNSSQVL